MRVKRWTGVWTWTHRSGGSGDDVCHVKRLGVVVQLGGHSRLDEHARIVQALISGRIDLVSGDERGRKPGKILYRGRSAQGFRDPRFLGIVNPENDAVYLPLKKGSNELMLAVSELGGGWGFICRVTDLEK